MEVERAETVVDPRISAATHFAEANRKMSDLSPWLAAFTTSPVVLLALVAPAYELYLTGKYLKNYTDQRRESSKH
jgi:hypothetical protein